MSDCCAPKNGNGHYDLAVIGAGSAGFSAAITAAGEGAQVALIGHGTIGGTCVNVGCVPSKTMIRAAEALHGARAAQRFDGLVGDAHVDDWSRVVAAKDELVRTLRRKKYTDLLPDYNSVAYLEGEARVIPDGVAFNGSAIPVPKIIIATGSSPAIPHVPGIADVPYLTSTTALELTELPRSLLVIGGGFIGCELAQMFARAGTAVTLVTRSRLLPDSEPQIAEALAGYLAEDGINVVAGLSYRQIECVGNGVALSIEQSGTVRTLEADQFLVTTGRAPNTHGLGLDEAGVTLSDRGAVRVDDHMRTSKPDIYAAGDVTDRDQFVYMAAYGAKLAALNALNGDTHTYDNAAMPWVVFTDPQVAGVGLSEARARVRRA